MIAIIFHPSFPKKLRNAEHFDLYENIAKHFEGKELPPLLVPFLTKFLQSFAREDTIYKRYLNKENTRLVKEAHEKRKVSIMALKRTFELGAYSEETPQQTAAASLLRVMENYSAAYYAPMTETSAMIVNMIQDLKLPQYASAITLLNATDAIARLKRDNDEFMTLYAERAYNEGEQKDEGSLFEARNQDDHDFGNLANAINVFYQANEMQHPKDPAVSTVLGDIIRFINSYLRQHEAIYARRNPQYHPGGSDKPSPDEDLPGEEIPILIITAQAIAGTLMSLTVDAAAFAPVAESTKDGFVYIKSPETNTFVAFPITSLLMDTDEVTPIGCLVDPPASNETFDKPFFGFGPAEAYITYQDGETLAILQGAQYPSMTRED
ncbi:MAG: DUF6261 family protein [Tannerellaceae bacterium]|jgi:hypothetical protein|nr:DUF6261 family protein [Tannerellaceae bacterium]